jgi:phosphoribosylaminoimidazole-succinocarboxamide synthase
MAELVGRELASKLKELTLTLFSAASRAAEGRGFLLADTKFEFGLLDGKVILIDEALTPDSSRYWDAASWRPGVAQDSFDKQYVRDYLTKIGWNRQPPAPALPDDVVKNTRAKYVAAYERITGRRFGD